MLKTKVSCSTHKETNEQREQGASLMLRNTSKGHEGDFWGADNVLCFDPGNGYTSVFTCKNSLNYTPKNCTLSCM